MASIRSRDDSMRGEDSSPAMAAPWSTGHAGWSGSCRNIAVPKPKAMALSPIADDCLHQGQGSNRGRVGPQDSRSETDGDDEWLAEQEFALFVGKPAFGAHQDANGKTVDRTQLRYGRAGRHAFVAQDQPAQTMHIAPGGKQVGQRNLRGDFGHAQHLALLGRLDD